MLGVQLARHRALSCPQRIFVVSVHTSGYDWNAMLGGVSVNVTDSLNSWSHVGATLSTFLISIITSARIRYF